MSGKKKYKKPVVKEITDEIKPTESLEEYMERNNITVDEMFGIKGEDYAKGGIVDVKLLEIWKKHVEKNKDEWFDDAYDIAYEYNEDKGIDEDDIADLSHDQAHKLIEHYGISYAKGGEVKNEKITVKSDFIDLTYLNRELNKVNKAIQSVLTNKNDNGNIIELERRKLALNKLISYKQ